MSDAPETDRTSLREQVARASAITRDWAHAITTLGVASLTRFSRAARQLTDPSTDVSASDCARVPVVILPGILEPWSYLKAMGRWFQSQGHPVHYVERLGHNIRGLPHSTAQTLQILRDRDLHEAVLLAHSKGGLIGKSVMLHPDVGDRVAGMVSVATPFAGSSLGGRWQRLVRLSPLGLFAPSSAPLRALAAELEVNSRIVSVAPAWDQAIPEGSHLDGATNVALTQGGHFRPLDDPEVWTILHDHVHALASTGRATAV